MAKKKSAASPKLGEIICSLQGGGALGAYQVGILKGLHEAGYIPGWFVGTSIGGINAAICAGNEPKDRIDRLEAFWSMIAGPDPFDLSPMPDEVHSKRLHHHLSAQSALLFGQPGFFKPRFPPPEFAWHDDPTQISYYDTSPLKQTLEKLIDFERINSKHSRLSVGAVELCTGQMTYFDSNKQQIKPEHIMASGALPPGFPAVEIDGRLYWDGGISSNSPIGYVLRNYDQANSLCFMVHLFDSLGLQPRSLDEILKRKKDIEFSSRFMIYIDLYKEIHELRYAINQLSQHLPDQKQAQAMVKQCSMKGWDKTISVVRYLFHGDESDLSSKDYEFSKHSIQERMDKGYADARRSLNRSPWLAPVPEDDGIALYDFSNIQQQED